MERLQASHVALGKLFPLSVGEIELLHLAEGQSEEGYREQEFLVTSAANKQVEFLDMGTHFGSTVLPWPSV